MNTERLPTTERLLAQGLLTLNEILNIFKRVFTFYRARDDMFTKKSSFSALYNNIYPKFGHSYHGYNNNFKRLLAISSHWS